MEVTYCSVRSERFQGFRTTHSRRDAKQVRLTHYSVFFVFISSSFYNNHDSHLLTLVALRKYFQEHPRLNCIASMLIKVLIKEKAGFMSFHLGFLKLFRCY